MDREAGPSGVEEDRYRVREEIVQVEWAEEERSPEFARTTTYLRPRRRRRNIRLRRSRFTFAYCLLSLVIMAVVYFFVKHYLIHRNDLQLKTSNTIKRENICPPTAKEIYDERNNIRSHTSFIHGGYCYYILQVEVGAVNFTNCIVEGFMLSHFIQRGNAIRRSIFNKVRQLGHDDKAIHIGAFLECDYCQADMHDYVCRGCIINEMVTQWYSNGETREYKCPEFKTTTPWDASSHGLQFIPPCIRPMPRKRSKRDELMGGEYNYGIYIERGQFKYIKEATNTNAVAWYLCEMKL